MSFTADVGDHPTSMMHYSSSCTHTLEPRPRTNGTQHHRRRPNPAGPRPVHLRGVACPTAGPLSLFGRSNQHCHPRLGQRRRSHRQCWGASCGVPAPDWRDSTESLHPNRPQSSRSFTPSVLALSAAPAPTMDATAWFHVAVSNTSLASCISNVSANSSAFGATAAATVTTTAPTTLGFFAAWHRPGSDAKEIFGPYSSYVAIGVVVVAAILSGVGGVVQKVAHRNSSGRQYCPRPLTTSACCLMTAGIVITILAAGLDLAALMFGNIALVVPLGSLKLVVIAFLSALCYRQRLEWWDALWVACIIVGCAATVYFSVPRVCIFTLADLEGLYTRPGVIAYASTVGCLIVGVLIFLACVRQIEKRHGTDSPRYRSLQLAQRNAYPVGAGMIGAQGVLFAKALVEIITDYAIRPPGTPAVNSSSQYIWFAMGAGVVFFISMQIFLINEGLSRFRAVSQLPVFQCTWTLWSVAGGAVFYVEMSMFDVADWIFYPLGVVLVLTGFVMLEVRRSRFKIKRNSVDTTAVRLLEGYGE